MDKIGLVFPGQGSQFVGMGANLVKRHETFREIFARAGEILDIDLLSLCLKGPKEDLDRTVNTQLAVLVFEIAAFETLMLMHPFRPAVLAGHSLGEYSAIYASGALDLKDVLKLVRARAQRHDAGIPRGLGAMAAIVGFTPEQVGDLCRESSTEEESVELANLNAPVQIVVSGHVRAVERLMEKAKESGAKIVVLLPISVPCHCRLLRGVSELLHDDVEKVIFKSFQIPVIPNYDPAVFYNRENARELLIRQITSPVRWQETVEKMAAMGIGTVLEIGPKKILSGLIKTINKEIRLFYAGDADSLQNAVSVLSEFENGSFPPSHPAEMHSG